MDSIKWTRKQGGGFSTYRAKVDGTFYRITPAPFSGWYVETAQPGKFWQCAGMTRTVADAKAWVSSTTAQVAA